MVGVGGSSPLGRTKFLRLIPVVSPDYEKFIQHFKLTHCFLYENFTINHGLLLQAWSFFHFTVIINLHNHFLIHFTEITLYNTAQFIVEWFQHINLPNAGRTTD